MMHWRLKSLKISKNKQPLQKASRTRRRMTLTTILVYIWSMCKRLEARRRRILLNDPSQHKTTPI